MALKHERLIQCYSSYTCLENCHTDKLTYCIHLNCVYCSGCGLSPEKADELLMDVNLLKMDVEDLKAKVETVAGATGMFYSTVLH